MKFPWQKKEGSETEIEISLPEEQQKKIDAAAAAGAEIPEIKNKLSKLDSVTEFIETFKQERQAEKDKANAAKNKETQDARNAEIEELMLTDPKKAVEMATEGHKNAILMLRADNLRRETFEDRERFPYYEGDIKKEVDALLNGQALMARNDPGVIENCYLTVMGKHVKDITEGKLKTRFASGDGSSRGTASGSAAAGGSSEAEKHIDPALKDDVAKAAKILGYKTEEYEKMLIDSGVGYA